MLTVFFGNDTGVVRTAALTYAHERAHTPAQIERYAPENLESGELPLLAGAQSLFGEPLVYVLDTLSSDTERFEELLGTLPALAAATYEFIVIEGALTVPLRRAFTEAGATLKEHSRAKDERFNTFALGDAMLLRDKKTLWLLLMDARQAGVTPEEIIGTLLWQIKVLRLSFRTKSAAEADVKPYVYQKATRAHSRFTKAEADQCSRTLLTMYHQGHHGETDLDLALEAWVLAL